MVEGKEKVRREATEYKIKGRYVIRMMKMRG